MQRLVNTIKSFWEISKTLETSFLKLVFAFIFWKLISNKIVKFNFKYLDKKFNFYADNRVDLAAIDEIFVKKEYDFEYQKMENDEPESKEKIILDLGANVGDTAIFYALKFPDVKIFAVEPNPHVHQKLEMNAGQFPNIVVRKCAISDTTGKINLNFGESHLGSSINSREQNRNSVEVDVYSLKDFCENNNIARIDILKFDIEGAEEYLLKDFEFINKNVVQMVGEMHEDLVTIPINDLLGKIDLINTKKKILGKNRYILYASLDKQS